MSVLSYALLAFTLPVGAQFAAPGVGPSIHAGASATHSNSLAATCEPSWSRLFGGWPGTNGEVKAACAYDDGSGTALYVTVDSPSASYSGIVSRWDGARWTQIGHLAGNGFTALTSLAVYDDGRGEALYVGGDFQSADGIPVAGLARWDGVAWEKPGITIPMYVEALCVYDAGNGPKLYVGTRSGLVRCWDGNLWSTVGSANGDIQHLLVHDDGSGPRLYASGLFTTLSGQTAHRIACWDGTDWSPVGGGLGGNTLAMAQFDEGHGPRLFAGGLFDHAGGQPANQIARWDGTQWTPLGPGLNFTVECLEVFDEGAGPALFAGGSFTSAGGAQAHKIARWNGSSWTEVGGGLGAVGTRVRALAVHDDGQGPALFVGGYFGTVGALEARSIVAWTGSTWRELGERGLDGPITALLTHDDGNGPALYASGYFSALGTTPLNRILRWDGQTATPLGSGSAVPVGLLGSFDAGSGAELIVTGNFTEIGGVPAASIARWNGSSWNPLGSGLGGGVARAIAVFDDGTGSALYVGGGFSSAGGHPVSGLARWNGTDWWPVPGHLDGAILTLAVLDDGSGPALYVGGQFTHADGLLAPGFAKWDGSAWHALGTIPGTSVRLLTLFDDSTGPALHASGTIYVHHPPVLMRMARWNGSGFVSLGGTWSSPPTFLECFDDGRGPALYAGGGFTLTTDVTISRLARWDGAAWSAVPDPPGYISNLAVFDAGQGAALYTGSQSSSQPGSSYLHQLQGCPPRFDRTYCFGTAAQCPCGNAGGYQAGCGNSNGIGGSLVAGGSGSLLADDLTLSARELMILQPALLFAGTNAPNAGLGVPFGDGLRCAGGVVRRLGVRTSSMFGNANWGPALLSQGAFAAGATARFQVWYRDPSGSPCGAGFNLTNGMAVTVAP